MKPNELRIGNWLNHKGIDIEWAIEDFAEVEKAGILEVTKPIPLTPEWLEKFGFEKLSDGAPIYCYKISGWSRLVIGGLTNEFKLFELQSVDVKGNEFKEIIAIEPIKYVHQLQNLYFALTGNELNEKTN